MARRSEPKSSARGTIFFEVRDQTARFVIPRAARNAMRRAAICDIACHLSDEKTRRFAHEDGSAARTLQSYLI
jgi:hypothetical protein